MKRFSSALLIASLSALLVLSGCGDKETDLNPNGDTLTESGTAVYSNAMFDFQFEYPADGYVLDNNGLYLAKDLNNPLFTFDVSKLRGASLEEYIGQEIPSVSDLQEDLNTRKIGDLTFTVVSYEMEEEAYQSYFTTSAETVLMFTAPESEEDTLTNVLETLQFSIEDVVEEDAVDESSSAT
jgi:hypothetical protein